MLLHGPPGSGKTLAAEALGFETGRPLRVEKYGYVSQSDFDEGAKNDAIMVYEQGEKLFRRTEEPEEGKKKKEDNQYPMFVRYFMITLMQMQG